MQYQQLPDWVVSHALSMLSFLLSAVVMLVGSAAAAVRVLVIGRVAWSLG